MPSIAIIKAFRELNPAIKPVLNTHADRKAFFECIAEQLDVLRLQISARSSVLEPCRRELARIMQFLRDDSISQLFNAKLEKVDAALLTLLDNVALNDQAKNEIATMHKLMTELIEQPSQYTQKTTPIHVIGCLRFKMPNELVAGILGPPSLNISSVRIGAHKRPYKQSLLALIVLTALTTFPNDNS